MAETWLYFTLTKRLIATDGYRFLLQRFFAPRKKDCRNLFSERVQEYKNGATKRIPDDSNIYRQADVNLRFAGNRTGGGEKCMIMKTVPVQS